MPLKLPPFPSSDRKPKYTVKDVAEMMSLSTHTVRYYENSGLIPFVDRTKGNIRMFSEYSLNWLRIVHCLRSTGLSIDGVRHYIALCMKGDSTIPERGEIIFKQEAVLREQLEVLQKQMSVLEYKKAYYRKLIAEGKSEAANPANLLRRYRQEPDIFPARSRSDSAV